MTLRLQSRKQSGSASRYGVLLDEEFGSKLKIVKKMTRQRNLSWFRILRALKVYDLDNKKYVEQVTTYHLLWYINLILRMRMDT